MLMGQTCGPHKTNAKHFYMRTSRKAESAIRLSYDSLETSKIYQKIAEITCMLRNQSATFRQPCDFKEMNVLRLLYKTQQFLSKFVHMAAVGLM
jgi:hypothetical protein